MHDGYIPLVSHTLLWWYVQDADEAGAPEEAGEGEATKEKGEKDVYDTMLTQGEIQEAVIDVNTTVKRQEAEAKCELVLLTSDVIRNLLTVRILP